MVRVWVLGAHGARRGWGGELAGWGLVGGGGAGKSAIPALLLGLPKSFFFPYPHPRLAPDCKPNCKVRPGDPQGNEHVGNEGGEGLCQTIQFPTP